MAREDETIKKILKMENEIYKKIDKLSRELFYMTGAKILTPKESKNICDQLIKKLEDIKERI